MWKALSQKLKRYHLMHHVYEEATRSVRYSAGDALSRFYQFEWRKQIHCAGEKTQFHSFRILWHTTICDVGI